MKLSVASAAAVLTLALAGCGGDADPVSGAASGLSAATSSAASASPFLSGSAGSSESESESAGAAQEACRQQPSPRPELLRQLPADFPTVTGWQPTELAIQGQSRAFSGVLRGEVADLVTVRDNAADELVNAGYIQAGSDEEVGFEAEAEFNGPQEVSIKVKLLCRDYLVLTYTVRQ
ncbi:MAG: hypothetical protein ABI047_07665 [Jatrophihabitantaceae bacterium]